jgi:hypothetical protein
MKEENKFLSWTAAVLVIGMVGTLGYLAVQEDPFNPPQAPEVPDNGIQLPSTADSPTPPTGDGRPETEAPVVGLRSSVSYRLAACPFAVEVTFVRDADGRAIVVMPLEDLETQIRAWRNCG